MSLNLIDLGVILLLLFVMLSIFFNGRKIKKFLLSPFKKQAKRRAKRRTQNPVVSFIRRNFANLIGFLAIVLIVIGFRAFWNNVTYMFYGTLGEVLFFAGLFLVGVYILLTSLNFVSQAIRKLPRPRRSMRARENDPNPEAGIPNWTNPAQ